MSKNVRVVNLIIDSVLKVTGWISALAILVMAVIVCYDVLARYTGNPTIWAFDVVIYLLIWISFLGAAYGVKRDSHFRVTLIIERLNPKRAIWLHASNATVGMFFFLGVGIQGTKLVLKSIAQNLHTPTLFSVPLWVPQLGLALGAVLVSMAFFQKLVNIIAKHCVDGEPL